MGIASLVLAIVGALVGLTIFKDLSIILFILALVLGVISAIRKKNLVISIIAVVLAVIGLIVVFAKDDNKKATETGNEIVTSVDENGNVVTSVKSNSNAKAQYEVGNSSAEVWTNSIGTKWIKVVVPIKNTGSENLYISPCTIDIENSEGNLEDTLSLVSAYPQVVKPGETAYYYEETTYEGTSAKGLKAVAHAEVEKANVDCIRYPVSEVQVKDKSYGGASVLGRVENNTNSDAEMVYVVANLFDSNKNFIGQEFTIMDGTLAAGAKKSFETSSLMSEISASKVSYYEIYAFPQQYQW